MPDLTGVDLRAKPGDVDRELVACVVELPLRHQQRHLRVHVAPKVGDRLLELPQPIDDEATPRWVVVGGRHGHYSEAPSLAKTLASAVSTSASLAGLAAGRSAAMAAARLLTSPSAPTAAPSATTRESVAS